VSLSWAVPVTLAPGSHPFAIGSTSGSVLNVVFGFNGIARLSGNMVAGGTFATPPSVFRLLSGVGTLAQLFGVMLVAALALVAAAVAVNWRRRGAGEDPDARRLVLAFWLAIAVWLTCGVAVLSYVTVFHARYLETVTPAVAAALGCGLACLVTGALGSNGPPRSRVARLVSVSAMAAALAGVCWYTSSLASAWVLPAAAFAAGAVCAGVFAVLVPRATRPAKWLPAGLALACCLIFPIRESQRIVRSAQSDSPGLPVYPRSVEAAVSRYLRPRTLGLRYELAVDDPLGIAPLIIHDARPILPLTSFGAKPLVGLGELWQAVRSGAVRYALVGSYHCPRPINGAACVPAAIWVRNHGVDVSAQVGIPTTVPLRLYRLPG
jgi:hypothetical protein